MALELLYGCYNFDEIDKPWFWETQHLKMNQ